jgi:hypothetical protein
MADSKISALTALVAADVVSSDVLPIVDISATTTKKITVSSLAASIAAIGLNAGEGVPTIIHGIELPTGHQIRFEGSTDNAFETFLTVVDPTADRTITFPNETGTVALVGQQAYWG